MDRFTVEVSREDVVVDLGLDGSRLVRFIRAIKDITGSLNWHKN